LIKQFETGCVMGPEVRLAFSRMEDALVQLTWTGWLQGCVAWAVIWPHRWFNAPLSCEFGTKGPT
jgi:hypothetical protein